MAAAPPLPQITPAHLPGGYKNLKPPLLYFGWSFEPEDLLQWATRNGINTTVEFRGPVGPPKKEHNSFAAVIEPEVLKTLTDNAGTSNLRLRFEYGARSEGRFLLVISSNYSFARDQKVITKPQIDVLDKYLKEQEVAKHDPAWHLDCELFKWRLLY